MVVLATELEQEVSAINQGLSSYDKFIKQMKPRAQRAVAPASLGLRETRSAPARRLGRLPLLPTPTEPPTGRGLGLVPCRLRRCVITLWAQLPFLSGESPLHATQHPDSLP